MSEKRGFGSKLSSIFNQGHGSPNDKKPHGNSTRGISPSPSQSPKPRPLSKPHLNNRSSSATLNSSLHPTNHGVHSLHSKSSASTLRANVPSGTQHSALAGSHVPHPQVNITQPDHEMISGKSNPETYDHQTRSTLYGPNVSSLHQEEETKPSLYPFNSLHPSTSANSTSPKPQSLRRKPPSDLDSFDFAVNDQKSDRTSGSARSLSRTINSHSDKIGTGITADILGDLESEIDHFLQLDKSDSSEIRYTPTDGRSISDSVYFDREYDESHPDFVHELNLNRSKAFDQLEETVEGSQMHTQQTPYPIDSFLDSPSESPTRTPADSLENSPQIIQNYMMDTRGLEQVNPFEMTLSKQLSEQRNAFDAPISSQSSVYSSTSPSRQKAQYETSTNPSSDTMPVSTTTQSVRSPVSRSSTNTSRIPSSALPNQSPTHSIHQQSQSLQRAQGMQQANHPPQPRQPPQSALQHTSTDTSGFSFSHANSMKSYNTSNTHRNFHRNSSSVGSIKSSNSYKNVNLASLKRSLSLKPGEGERSNYVLAIRRSAGTAFNESGPSRWKLPVGILPVDKTATKENSNGKYKRLAGNLSGSNSRKKTSGVELKHGHLKPRLLAAEIDEGDDGYVGIGLTRTTTTTNPSVANTFSSRNQSVSTKASRENSLKRTTTDGSVLTGDTQSIVSSATGSTKGNTNEASLHRTDSIVSSESSGSLSDKITGYYQHRGYKYGDIDEESEDKSSAESPGASHNGSSLNGFNSYDSYGKQEKYDDYEENDRPRLVLANPDNDSDTE
ncbi:hypothetical protein CANMA_003038 [Candida margitis]|uniref:uncharacterized protein n=1 Tax=Candida margitis TaxID=1775924 RepID=UPI0022277C00|nr:uncharacterized protein CANMA_003038 [Candida margitis]KAI5967491.1 hypothetical protein CANMA_003038 [Candida margitis]